MNRTAWWRYRSHEKRLAYVKEIRKPQCAFRSFENSGRRAPCKAVNLAGHVGLVGVTRKCPPIRKRLPVTLPLAQKQKSLKTKHRLKHLRTIANRGRKASMNLSVADAGQPAELPTRPDVRWALSASFCGASQKEANYLEPRFWIVSVLPTIHELARFMNLQFLGNCLHRFFKLQKASVSST
jgi:hypothetical protein